MNKTHLKSHEKKQGRVKNLSKIWPKNQIITAYCIELRVQEMTMNEKITMIDLTLLNIFRTKVPSFQQIIVFWSNCCKYRAKFGYKSVNYIYCK